MKETAKPVAYARSDDWKVETGDFDVTEYLDSLPDEKLVAIFQNDYFVRDGAVEFYEGRDGHPAKTLSDYCRESGEGFEAYLRNKGVLSWIEANRPQVFGKIKSFLANAE